MNSSIFPLPLTSHIIFVVIAVVFFIIQFIRLKNKYQIVMAAVAAVTMLIYVNDSKVWFYGVGILELGLLVLALILSIVEKKSKKETESLNNNQMLLMDSGEE